MEKKKNKSLPKKGGKVKKYQFGGTSNINSFDVKRLNELLEQLQGLQQGANQQIDPFKNLNQFQVNPTQGFALGGMIEGIKKEGSGEYNFSKEGAKHLRLGGLINETGYTKGSSTENNPINIIPGGLITSDGIEKPLILYPIKNGELGIPQLMKPNTGMVEFEGAEAVMEIPADGLGNVPQRMRGGFQLGGTAEAGGEQAPQFVGIQTEKGEEIVHLDASITSVKAKDMHEDMDDDRVTDIVPEGTYIASDHESMKLDKEDAEEVEVGTIITPYDEWGYTAEPEKINLAELFKGKKEVTPADLVRKVKGNFKVTDRDDYFSQAANDENRMGRLPYLAGIIELAEDKREGTSVDKFIKGGKVKPTKAQLGLIVGAGASLLTGFLNKRAANRAARANTAALNAATAKQQQLQTEGTQARLAGLFAQNPNVSAPTLNSSFLNQIPTNTPLGLTDFNNARVNQSGNALTQAAFGNTGSFQRAINSVQPSAAARANQISANALANFADRQNRERDVLLQRGQIANQQAGMDNTAYNSTIRNTNNILNEGGRNLQGLNNAFTTIEGNRFNSQTAINNQNVQNQVAQNSQIASSIGQLGAGLTAAGIGNNLFGGRVPEPQYSGGLSVQPQAQPLPIGTIPSFGQQPLNPFRQFGQNNYLDPFYTFGG